jgi:hypothetical protein
MVTPRVRAFREREWLGRNPQGEPVIFDDERDAKAHEVKVGWIVREYHAAPAKEPTPPMPMPEPQEEEPAMPAEEPFL